MITKKFKHLTAVVILAASLFGFATPAMANNHGDTGWGFTLEPYNKIGRTSPRQKQDRSSSYVRLYNKSDGGRMWAWIERTYGNPDVSSRIVGLYPWQAAYISQYAYEKYGRVQVSACVQSEVNRRVTLNGVWSPDSV